MIDLKQVAPEVYYTAHRFPVVDSAAIDFLIEQAVRLPRLRCRICFHAAPDETVHEMLIVHHRDCFIRPHMHLDREESLTVLRGAADLALFDEDGSLSRVVSMGTPDSGKAFFYRLPARTLHSLVIHSEWLVFQEVCHGPFNPESMAFPDWAPDGQDAGAAKAWSDKIRRQTAEDFGGMLP